MKHFFDHFLNPPAGGVITICIPASRKMFHLIRQLADFMYKNQKCRFHRIIGFSWFFKFISFFNKNVSSDPPAGGFFLIF